MLNVHIEEIIYMTIIYLFIIQILRLFILSRIKSKNAKIQNKNKKNLYINDNCATKPTNEKSCRLEDITEEISKDNLCDNFKIEKSILVIHSNVTI